MKDDASPSLRESIRSSALMLGLFAAASTSLLALTHCSTKSAIARSEQQMLLNELQHILPPNSFDNALTEDLSFVSDPRLGSHEPVKVWRARRDGQINAVIVAAEAPDGYNGRIGLLVGIQRDGSLAGVRVTTHRETPGLGDDVDISRSDWILGFTGKSLGNPDKAGWAVKKDGGIFDQFTGATITPRAVVKAVHNTLQVYADNPQAFLADHAAAAE
ncbi:electron transport complex subunit RsxG [Granulosicoccaceae sp. 1_MG-2023]|nr:electron transport complex subunit RsxG [Granulosicoccaceae sp. 1_MG-2023]